MRFLYGKDGVYIDVTASVLKRFWSRGVITIPSSDITRARKLGDPLVGVEKYLKFYHEEKKGKIPAGVRVKLPFPLITTLWRNNKASLSTDEERLQFLHKHLILTQGSMRQEYPEQVMAIKYVRPEATVLELGGNIGRNSLIIASVLSNSKRLVVLECDPHSASVLKEHRDINHLSFHVEACALSNRKLCQRGWLTQEYKGKQVPKGYTPIQTITWPKLKEKYPLVFDTLVADCEGALLPILQDFPILLESINTVIVENDYRSKEEKILADQIFQKAGFTLIYNAGNNKAPCKDLAQCFYQVFQREKKLEDVGEEPKEEQRQE